MLAAGPGEGVASLLLNAKFFCHSITPAFGAPSRSDSDRSIGRGSKGDISKSKSCSASTARPEPNQPALFMGTRTRPCTGVSC